MHMSWPIGFWAALIFSSLPAAAYECKFNDLDHTAPTQIRASVRNQIAKFDWVTDVDIEQEKSWRCNCIINKDDKGWSGAWKKGGIEISVSNPLPVGEGTCYGEFLGKHNKELDRNAPISYGTTSQKQNAVVYVAANAPDQKAIEGLWQVKLTSSFLNEGGKSIPVSLDLRVIRKEETNHYWVSITPSPGITVSIAAVDQIISNPQFAKWATAEESVSLVSDLAAWQAAKSPFDQMEIQKDSALLIAGPTYTTLSKNSDLPEATQTLELKLFDANRRLILTSSVDLPKIK